MKIKPMRLIGLLTVGLFGAAALAACSSNSSSTDKKDSKKIDDLKISFIPSKNPDDITTATKPLANILKSELKKEGYTVDKISMSVGTNYEAVGEALDSGAVDVGYGVSGGTYAMYKDTTTPILTSTRKGLSNDESADAKYWNEHTPTTPTATQVTSYRALILAGPSAKGKELAKKINAGEKLTWSDINSAKWGVSSSTSAAGYMYPSLWLQDNFKHSIRDLKSTVTTDSYDSAFAQLSSGQIDVMPVFADGRIDDATKWQTTFSGKNPIWEDVQAIGVTKPIYNDAIVVSNTSKNMSKGLEKALQTSIKNMAKTPEGKKVIAIYSHDGYKDAKESDYQSAFDVLKLMSKNK